jgi:hypothetical protein
VSRSAPALRVVAVVLALGCGPSDRPPPDDNAVTSHRACAVAVVRGRVVDARGRGAIVQMKYSGSLDGWLHFTDNEGRFAHRLVGSGLHEAETDVAVMPLYAGTGETTQVRVRRLPWGTSRECGQLGEGPRDTLTLRVQLPPVRRPAG